MRGRITAYAHKKGDEPYKYEWTSKKLSLRLLLNDWVNGFGIESPGRAEGGLDVMTDNSEVLRSAIGGKAKYRRIPIRRRRAPLKDTIEYFEGAIRDGDNIVLEYSEDGRLELRRQQAFFFTALDVLREADKSTAELSDKLNRAVEAMTALAHATDSDLPCSFCQWNPLGLGCVLDGSRFNDDGECHFTWVG